MLTALGVKVARLKEYSERLLVEKNNFIARNAKLVDKSEKRKLKSDISCLSEARTASVRQNMSDDLHRWNSTCFAGFHLGCSEPLPTDTILLLQSGGMDLHIRPRTCCAGSTQ